ncbi:PssE/Cps14G family polysaccharide biosynthesis glycosyltransferase [Oceanobacillus bengalensis]|uniref:Exopolysaccharide biosynthesis protein n=1 Tax=Oceanobacillus bengalensis TaxID=1435466 RepID=A0A494YRF0_9BACI|nr:PssE/Cps14G family polysaccharide biosynthesis glycosyltransferase [Oceanobacillus bengalensis]RKQ11958.1 exopolysaccharide biosynthesis protein [Oceanobacillus bengalensis]
MIFVVLGTHELPFRRLLLEVERLKRTRIIDEDIIVQHGHTKYQSDHMILKKFINTKEMDLLYDQANIVITHAGTGSIMNGLKRGKKLIAVPRLKKYGEHNDDHQLQITNVLKSEGHLLSWEEGTNLADVMEEAKSFEPKPFQSKRDQMHQIIEEFIKKI